MGVKVREKVAGSGIWWLFISHGGKRRSKKVGDKATANRLAKEATARLIAGDLDLIESQEKKTLNYYIGAWLSGSARSTLKEVTRTGYVGLHTKHIKGSSIGKTPVDKVTRLAVKNFLLEKLGGLSNSSVTHIRNTISGGCREAWEDEVISSNPCHGFTLASKQDLSRAPKNEPLNSVELSSLLQTVATHRPEYYAMVLTLSFTGIRLGECLALKWSDINYADRYIHVQRSYSHGAWSTPKNGRSRKVDLSAHLAKVLRARQLAASPDQELIFPSGKTGTTPVDGCNFRKRIFYPMLKKADLRRVRVHDLRHSFASLLIGEGKSMKYVSEQCGHGSIVVTMDTYGHLLVPEGDERGVDILDALLCTPSAPKEKRA